MYKLLIADDNATHRECVINYVDWNSFGFKDIRTATNGEEALTLYKEFNPDLVITDVVMPVKNGIVLSEDIRKLNKDVHIVFMSCHEEYNYVKHAIDNNITAYISKPLEPRSLKMTVAKIVANIEQQKENLLSKQTLNEFIPLVRESLFYRLLYSNDFAPSYEMLKNANLVNTKNNILISNTILNADTNYNMLYKAIDTIEPYFNEFSVISVVSLPNKFITLVLTEGDDAEVFLESVISSLHKHIDYLKQSYNLNIASGLSNIHTSLKQISQMFSEATSALKNAFNPSAGEIYLFDGFEDENTVDIQFNLPEIKNELSALLDSGDINYIEVFLKKYYSNEITSLKPLCFAVVTTLQLLFIERGTNIDNLFETPDVVWNKLNRFETIQDTYHWLTNILTACCEHIIYTETKNKNMIVTSIKEYIDSNYSEITSLQQIAQNLFISAGYARNLFKKHTGQTIFDYLVDKRIEEAKKLLANSEYKIYEIMSLVGYTSKAHFIEIFKRKTGVTPKEYRQKM